MFSNVSYRTSTASSRHFVHNWTIRSWNRFGDSFKHFNSNQCCCNSVLTTAAVAGFVVAVFLTYREMEMQPNELFRLHTLFNNRFCAMLNVKWTPLLLWLNSVFHYDHKKWFGVSEACKTIDSLVRFRAWNRLNFCNRIKNHYDCELGNWLNFVILQRNFLRQR